MVDATLAMQWFALAWVFLISSIWSERNVKYGYIITTFMTGFFFIIGWIKFPYLTTVIPLVMMIAILAYLRTHLRTKFGVFGSSGGLIFKIVVFVIFLQFAIILVNGLAAAGVYDQQFAPDQTSAFDTYQVDNAGTSFGAYTTGNGLLDPLYWGFGIIVAAWTMFMQVFVGFFSMYDTMCNVFGMPAMLARIISFGVYMMTLIEIYVLVFKPFRAPEI